MDDGNELNYALHQFIDYELENDEQYHQYLEKYVEFIPNDTE